VKGNIILKVKLKLSLCF